MTGRTLFSTFLVIVAVSFGIFFIWAMDIGFQRIEANKNICSEHNMSSITINKGTTVLCVDNKGQVFYLRNKDIE